MADEYIRLDTTIIGIDSLINKASTAEEAKVLFTAKDVIYSQQRYVTDVQPVKHGRWESSQRTIETGTVYCSNCAIEYYISDLQTVGDCNGIVHYCPNCGARMIKDGDTNG